jgi:predicted ferric reductase
MLTELQSPRSVAAPEQPAPGVSLARVMLIIVGAFVVGFLGAALLRVNWLAGIQTSLSGTAPTAFWYLSRSTAFVAFGLLWLSMVLGLSITNRLARVWPGGPATTDLHQYTSLLGLALGCVHWLLLTGDSYSNFTLAQLLIPFATAQYRPLWVGFGQVGLYLGAIVGLSFYSRRWIGYKVWRALHFMSFVFFVMVLFHGLMSGTDSGSILAIGMYLGTGISVLALTVYRIMVARGAAAAKALQPARQRPTHA